MKRQFNEKAIIHSSGINYRANHMRRGSLNCLPSEKSQQKIKKDVNRSMGGVFSPPQYVIEALNPDHCFYKIVKNKNAFVRPRQAKIRQRQAKIAQD